jgi:hypothetical protein
MRPSTAKLHVRGGVKVSKGLQGISIGARSDSAHGALGTFAGASRMAKVYTPEEMDQERRLATPPGGAWSERKTSVVIAADVSHTVQVGSLPVALGFRAAGSKTAEVHTLTLHDKAADADKQAMVRMPTVVEDILAMRPYEQTSDMGERTVGLGGSAAIGYSVGPAILRAGGEIFVKATGNIARDIERLPNDVARVRYRRLDGQTRIATLAATVGLDATKVLPPGALTENAASFVEKVAQAGISASWEKLKQNEAVFDVTIDLKTEGGRVAMKSVLQDDLSKAQLLAGFSDGGVRVNSTVNTTINAKSKTVRASVPGLQYQNQTTLLEKARTEYTPEQYTFTDAVDRTQVKDGFFSWSAERTTDIRMVHETRKALNADQRKQVAAGATILAPAPAIDVKASVDDSTAVLGVRFSITDEKTSLKDLQGRLTHAVRVAQFLGFSTDEYRPLFEVQQAVSRNLVPEEKNVLGFLADKRFGDTTLDLEGFVGPKGFESIFKGPRGLPRTAADFEAAYRESADHAGVARSLGEDELKERADRFTAAMMEAAALRQANHPARQDARESNEAYAARVRSARQATLFDDPNAYFEKLNALFNRVVEADGQHGVAGLTMLRLAGPKAISGRMELRLPEDAISGIGVAARDAVQRFGALGVLTSVRATFAEDGSLQVPVDSSRLPEVSEAAKALFGEGIEIATTNRGVVVSGIDIDDADRATLASIFEGGIAPDGSLTAPPRFNSRSPVLGPLVVELRGRLVLDNSSLSFVDVREALSRFGQRHLTERPTAVLIRSSTTKHGAAGRLHPKVVLEHRGANADWGTNFAHMAELRGPRADLRKSESSGESWILPPA